VIRHIHWQILLIVLGVILVGILLSYLALNYTTVLRPGSGGTYVEGIVGAPYHLNPLLSGYNEADRDLCALVFSGLTRFNERGEVVPDVARAWEITAAPDGVSYTFHLRPGVTWHDGTPLTADDVMFTVSLLQDPGLSAPPEIGAKVWRVVRAEKVDARTVRFTLPEAYAPFLDYTTIGILPAHLLKGINAADLPEASFNLNPVGTGPFQLEQIEAEGDAITSIVLRRYPRYYGKRPYLDRIQFRFYPSHQAVLKAYEAGHVEGIAQITREDLPRARTLPDLNLFSAPTAQYSLVFLNLRDPNLPFFQEPEVRQALLYAIDRQGIIDAYLGGQALVAHSPIIPGTWAYADDIPHYGYDPDKAAELLDNAGWVRQGVGEHLRRKEGHWFSFSLLTSSEPDRIAAAEAIAGYWASLGITVTVQTASPLEVHDALEARDFEAILVDLALPGDPDPYPFWHETQVDNGQNYAGFVHRRASEVLEQARVKSGDAYGGRLGLYHEFQQIFAQQVPALLLYVPVYTYGVDKRVHNVQIAPLLHPSDRFRTVANWWIVPRRVFVSGGEASQP